MKLERVTELYRDLKNLQDNLESMKISILQPARLDMPPAQNVSKPTEKAAIKILALEEEITRLQEEIIGAKAELAILILDTVSDSAVAQILIRKYVRQETFQRIATEMKYSLRHVFRLHAKGKKEFKE